MKKEKYGFIYLWYDKKYKRFYLGRHWGREDDWYICSSNSMRDAYRRRPKDFKRRILKRVYEKNALVEEEQRWLNMIPPQDCRVRYYNKSLKATAPSHRGYRHSEEAKRKIKESNSGRKLTEEHKEKLRQAKLGRVSNHKGKKLSEDVRKKISEAKMGNIPWNKGIKWNKVKQRKEQV